MARRSLHPVRMNGMRGVRIGRLFGIQLAFDWSWLFIVLLMTWSLTVAFAHWHPGWGIGLAFVIALVAALLFFGSVVLHELAHSLVARHYGIPVESITLFLFGGVSNIEREPPSAKAEFLMAVVGPLTSIVLGIVLLLIGSAVTRVTAGVVVDPALALSRLGPFETLLLWLGPINILVGLFNLIPGFPLDGGRMLRSAIWASTGDLHKATRWAAGLGQGIGWALVFLGVASAFGANVPLVGRGLVSGLWLAFIGWFLSSAASANLRRQLAQEILSGVPVARLMRAPSIAEREEVDLAHSVTISPYEDLAEALDRMLHEDADQLAVVENGRLIGVLLRSDVIRWLQMHARPRTRAHA